MGSVDENENPAEQEPEPGPPDELKFWYAQPWAEDWGHKRRREYWRGLVREAAYLDGMPRPLIPPSEVPWFDPELTKKGRQAAEDNLLLLVGGIITGLTFGRGFKNVSALFLKNFYPVNHSNTRFDSSMKAILAWNFGCTEDDSSSFFKEMERVCEMHRTFGRPPNPKIPPDGIHFPKWYSELAAAIKKDVDDSHWRFPEFEELCKIIKWNPPLRFSQFDVSIVSFAMIGPLFMGIYGNRVRFHGKDNLDGALHLIAICGRFLGVQDRFNLGLIKDPGLIISISRSMALFWLRSIDETVIYMMDAMMREASSNTPLLNFPRLKPFLLYFMNLSTVEGHNLWKTMDWQDKLAHYFTRFIMFMLQFGWFRGGMNAALKRLYKMELYSDRHGKFD